MASTIPSCGVDIAFQLTYFGTSLFCLTSVIHKMNVYVLKPLISEGGMFNRSVIFQTHMKMNLQIQVQVAMDQ